MSIQEILASNDPKQIKALFAFDSRDSLEAVLLKYNLWTRYFFPKYFSSPDAPFHKEIDLNNLKVYRGELESFVDVAFRGAAKTARTKLFFGYCIANDTDHFRKYAKINTYDRTNSTQIVTDIYNMLVIPRVAQLYPEIFEKTVTKREETMASFTTATGIKVVADTVGVDQRGAIQEEARPDWAWFEDFENRTTLRSNRVTQKIKENMEEARTGLSKNGGSIYTCNYLSEQGNVHLLVQKKGPRRALLIVPIIDDKGNLTWPSRYTLADVDYMRETDDDFEGERLCKPSASKDLIFDRETLEKQIPKVPKRIVAEFKIFKEYDPSHRYGSGHDVAGGVHLDSSASVFIDFDTIPAQVVATFKSNTIKPDTFGDEIHREGEFYSNPVTAIEKNNHGHATIARARQLDVNQLVTPGKETKINPTDPTEYGWQTNGLTKPKMLFAFAKAILDGHIELNDPDLIEEAKAYTRNDLIDDEKDPRMTTRHFDLLTAACIAWQTKDYATVAEIKNLDLPDEEKPLYSEIGI